MRKKLFVAVMLLTALALSQISGFITPALAAGIPNPPSELAASSSYPGDLAITLTWLDNSFDETAYEIERCTGAGCTDFSLLATRDSSIWGPWFNDVGLAEVTTYTYRVRSVNASGASEYSNTATATTSYARPNGQVITLTGVFNSGLVELTWTENATNETRFEIERYEVGGGEAAFTVIASIDPDTTSYSDATALMGTSYIYRVVPWRYDVFGGAPETVTVSTGTGIAAPEGLKASASGRTSIRLSWKGKFDAGTMVVVQRENCDVYGCYGWTTIGQVNAAEGRFTDSGLSPATTYSYRIRAVTATSVSPFTGSVTATIR